MPLIKFVAVVVYSLRYGNHLNTNHHCSGHQEFIEKFTDRNHLIGLLEDIIEEKYEFADGGVTVYIQDINIQNGETWEYLPV